MTVNLQALAIKKAIKVLFITGNKKSYMTSSGESLSSADLIATLVTNVTYAFLRNL